MKTALKIFFITLTFLAFGSPVALAQNDFRFLAPLPGIAETGDPVTLAQAYIPAAIKLIIAFAAAFAVVRIIFGGIQYMSTDAFGKKNDARKSIQESLWGLLLVVASFVILGTVNPALIGDIKLSLPKFEGRGDSGIDPVIDPTANFFQGCQDCNIFPPDVPHKSVGAGCNAVNPLNNAKVTACIVNTTLAQKLKEWGRRLEDEGIDLSEWWVSESFPPTRNHAATCHSNGTCVDVSLRGNRSASDIEKFISEASNVGLRAEYEVLTASRKAALVNAGVPESQVKVVPGITGEHFSIYMDSGRSW